MPKLEINPVEAAYLREIYRAIEKGLDPSTTYLARIFRVRPASAFDVVERLVKKNLAERMGWGRFRLSTRGMNIAYTTIHNHRILETYFYNELGFSVNEACIEAAKIDYCIGQEVVTRLCSRLNYPEKCIHGNEVKHRRCRNDI